MTPALILCLGLPGSASTWIYNVCIQLMMSTKRCVKCGFMDDFADPYETFCSTPAQSDVFVIKSHLADEELFDYVCLTGAKHVLTIRDPRDCIVSLMERFDYSFDAALDLLVASCRALMRFQSRGGILFRYEDQFFHTSRTMRELCHYLRLEESIDFESLMHAHSQESVMEFINNFDLLPPERIEKLNEDGDSYDALTHWHTHHFGDGLVGKWKTRLCANQQARANCALAPALRAFDYATPAGAGISPHPAPAPGLVET